HFGRSIRYHFRYCKSFLLSQLSPTNPCSWISLKISSRLRLSTLPCRFFGGRTGSGARPSVHQYARVFSPMLSANVNAPGFLSQVVRITKTRALSLSTLARKVTELATITTNESPSTFEPSSKSRVLGGVENSTVPFGAMIRTFDFSSTLSV